MALCCVRLNTWVAPGPHMAFILGLCRPFSKSFLGNRQQEAGSWHSHHERKEVKTLDRDAFADAACLICIVWSRAKIVGGFIVISYASPVWECLEWCTYFIRPEIWFRHNLPAPRLSPRSLYEALHQRKLGPSQILRLDVCVNLGIGAHIVIGLNNPGLGW